MPPSPLLKTPLHDLHLEWGGKMVPFAGYELPVHYAPGILKEHLHTRSQAGLFDISHLGQAYLIGKNAAVAIEQLVPVDIINLAQNRQRYALFTNQQGGILDDIMVTNHGEHLSIVFNAACKQQIIAHMQKHLSNQCQVQILSDQALLALQGPLAAHVLAKFSSETRDMPFMSSVQTSLFNMACTISRSGYTGEDGYEISLPSQDAKTLARTLLAQPEVLPIGLGARDSLRLEAGLPLYGHDLDTDTTPVEADLGWALSKARRLAGDRPGGYPGATIIMQQLQNGVSKKRVGLWPKERVIVREGTTISDQNDQQVGHVTSGGFSPTLEKPIAMGYVQTQFSSVGTALFAMVRGKKIAIEVTKFPFVATRYYRG